MKKILTVLLVVLMTLTMFGCEGEEGPTEKSKKQLAEEAGKITIANVVNGTLGDKSFFDSGEEGVKKINADFGDKVYAETIELGYDTSTWQASLSDIFKAGWTIVIAGTYDMKDYVIALLEEYPDQLIWFYDEEWNFDNPDGWQYGPSENLYAMMFAQNEGSFVVGAMAAMVSETKKIAFMGGMDNTVLDDFYVGFASGAKYVDPNMDINVSWMNSFSDVAAGKDTAAGLYAAGYDVVFACGGQAGLGGFDQVITEAEGKWIIGVDGDQGAYFASLGTDEGNKKAARTITSMQKNVNVGFYDAVQKHLAGTLEYGTNVKLGLDGGFVSYSVTDTTNALFNADQIAAVEAIVAGIIDGTIEVPTAFGKAEGWFYGEFVPAHDSTKK
ncbi:MAG TPA: BMP family ABC transporter substrate-binding protein [Erysipelotrichaceae bacterium]|nr:BMP family ABC transporter substrate-binding protein [Erysipelotrichaceae bacterium]